MAVLTRGDQFAGGGRQIGKGRRQGHGLPANQPAPQRPTKTRLFLSNFLPIIAFALKLGLLLAEKVGA